MASVSQTSRRRLSIALRSVDQAGFRPALVLIVVGSLNLLAWLAVISAAIGIDASVIAIGALSYLLGVQHGFDADHIAAIDNVTRKLRQDGQRPVATGLFFALGHSTVVIALSCALILGFGLSPAHRTVLEGWGDLLGPLFSAALLTVLGAINLRIFARLRGALAAGAGALTPMEAAEAAIESGPCARLFGFIYRNVDASWKMLPVGFLFGLGFDTATEIAMLGLSAEVAAQGRLPLACVMIFPLMFTAGMILVDALDGLIMMRVYDWAFTDPRRKLFFNAAITGVSAAMALAIAALEWLQWAGKRFALSGPLWSAVGAVDFSRLGMAMAGGLLIAWLVARRRYRRYFDACS